MAPRKTTNKKNGNKTPDSSGSNQELSLALRLEASMAERQERMNDIITEMGDHTREREAQSETDSEETSSREGAAKDQAGSRELALGIQARQSTPRAGRKETVGNNRQAEEESDSEGMSDSSTGHTERTQGESTQSEQYSTPMTGSGPDKARGSDQPRGKKRLANTSSSSMDTSRVTTDSSKQEITVIEKSRRNHQKKRKTGRRAAEDLQNQIENLKTNSEIRVAGLFNHYKTEAATGNAQKEYVAEKWTEATFNAMDIIQQLKTAVEHFGSSLIREIEKNERMVEQNAQLNEQIEILMFAKEDEKNQKNELIKTQQETKKNTETLIRKMNEIMSAMAQERREQGRSRDQARNELAGEAGRGTAAVGSSREKAIATSLSQREQEERRQRSAAREERIGQGTAQEVEKENSLTDYEIDSNKRINDWATIMKAANERSSIVNKAYVAGTRGDVGPSSRVWASQVPAIGKRVEQDRLERDEKNGGDAESFHKRRKDCEGIKTGTIEIELNTTKDRDEVWAGIMEDKEFAHLFGKNKISITTRGLTIRIQPLNGEIKKEIHNYIANKTKNINKVVGQGRIKDIGPRYPVIEIGPIELPEKWTEDLGSSIREERGKKIREMMIEANAELREARDKDITVIAYKKYTKKLLAQINPDMVEEIFRNGGRMYIGLMAAQIKEEIKPLRCLFCQRIGHIRKNCDQERNGGKPRCATCSRAHETRNCDNPLDIQCINCKRAGGEQIRHRSSDPNCPELIKSKGEQVKRTTYKGDNSPTNHNG